MSNMWEVKEPYGTDLPGEEVLTVNWLHRGVKVSITISSLAYAPVLALQLYHLKRLQPLLLDHVVEWVGASFMVIMVVRSNPRRDIVILVEIHVIPCLVAGSRWKCSAQAALVASKLI